VKNILYSIIEPLLQPETYQSLLSNLIMIIVYVVAAWILLHFVNKGIAQFFKIQNKGKNSNKKRSKTLISLVQNVVSYVVWFIVLTTILSKFGISVGGIIASAGVVGLAVGFGAQTVVKDIITGFFIIFENQSFARSAFRCFHYIIFFRKLHANFDSYLDIFCTN